MKNPRRPAAGTDGPKTDAITKVKRVAELEARLVELEEENRRLREDNDAHYRLFAESSSVMLIVDPESAAIVDANPAACEFYGYTREQLIARKITDINTLSREKVLSEMEQARFQRKRRFEFKHRLADGSVRDVEVYSGPILRYDRRLLLSIVHDVSERIQAEENGRAAERMLRTVIDAIPVRVFWKDRQSRYLGCNQTFARDSGLTAPEELIGRDDFDMGWRNEAELYRRDDRNVMDSGKPKLNYEEPQTTPSGGRIWLRTSKIPLRDAQGVVRGVLGTYEDITQRKEAEVRLRDTNASLERQLRFTEALLSAVPTPVFFKDAQGRYLGCNRAFSERTGLATDDVRGKTAFDLWPSEHARLYQEKDQELMREHAHQTYEAKLRVRDGTERDVIVAQDVFCDEAGSVAGLVGAYLDVTDLKRAEEERRALEARIQQAQKLESLGILAGGVAHDFNNLLTAILGNIDLAHSKVSSQPSAKLNLEQARFAAQRAAELSRQMLAYSGKGCFLVAPLDLNRTIRDLAHLLDACVSKKAALQYRFAPQLPAVNADAAQIRQVIMNLVINASEALDEQDGLITVTTEVKRCHDSDLKSPWLTDKLPAGDYVSLTVADTGHGMGADVIARIFDPFFSTKFTGRGLGLAVVLGIVRGHHGTIRVCSQPGHGTTFEVLLPACAQAAQEAEQERSAPEWRASGAVLLVDDEHSVRQTVGEMLREIGFDVLIAADGRQAVRLFQRHPEIRCVVLDLTMPYMDGEETFRELQRLRSDAKIVLSSGYDEHEATQRFAGQGLAGFVQKPYVRESLRLVLMNALAGSDASR